MKYEDVRDNLDPQVIKQLRRALELGRWPDGRRLTDRQKTDCMQAVIGWEAANLPPEERVGYIDRAGLGDSGKRSGNSSAPGEAAQPTALRWADGSEDESP